MTTRHDAIIDIAFQFEQTLGRIREVPRLSTERLSAERLMAERCPGETGRGTAGGGRIDQASEPNITKPFSFSRFGKSRVTMKNKEELPMNSDRGAVGANGDSQLYSDGVPVGAGKCVLFRRERLQLGVALPLDLLGSWLGVPISPPSGPTSIRPKENMFQPSGFSDVGTNVPRMEVQWNLDRGLRAGCFVLEFLLGWCLPAKSFRWIREREESRKRGKTRLGSAWRAGAPRGLQNRWIGRQACDRWVRFPCTSAIFYVRLDGMGELRPGVVRGGAQPAVSAPRSGVYPTSRSTLLVAEQDDPATFGTDFG